MMPAGDGYPAGIMEIEMREIERATRVIREYGEERYQEGLTDGLEVARKALGWLTRQPDMKRQREVRGWLATAIQRAEERGSG